MPATRPAWSPRSFLALAAGFGVAWLGGLILGEYPFDGFLPVVGGFLLGVAVVGAASFVEEGEDPPAWVTVAGAVLAVWGIWRAAWIDSGADGDYFGLVPTDGIGPLPSVAWWAMAAAGAGALLRLVPKPRRARLEAGEERPGEFSDGNEDDEASG